MTVTSPQGFSAAGITAGIKPSGKPDMALVLNNGPEHVAAAVFTSNRIVAAPVTLSRQHLADAQLRAVLLNSGNANACNGAPGLDDATELADRMAGHLGVNRADIGVCSTGIIGERLPMDVLRAGVDQLIDALGDDDDHGQQAAAAIMTTDTVAKSTKREGNGYTIGAIAKGVGMMAPALATMLVVITTDAKIDARAAQDALEDACAKTFNTLDIDGSTSTNDTVMLMANGASGSTPDEAEFAELLTDLCTELATMLQDDGEGATKRVVITVTGARTDDEALNVARTLGRDNLFKCAMYGSDPNWGRVLAAIGTADADMNADNITVAFNDHVVCRDTMGTPDSRDVDLSGREISVDVDLGLEGAGTATVRTTDLSVDYVQLNSAYST